MTTDTSTGGTWKMSPAPRSFTDEHIANAYLLGAAKDLYEALEAVKTWEGLFDSFPEALSVQIQGALAKARGEAR